MRQIINSRVNRKRPRFAAWFAPLLLLLLLLPAASHATTFYDDLNDWSYTASHTTNWTFDTSNSSYFQGDASRATRTVDDTESFTYARSNISNFNIGYYTYAGTLSQLSVFYSTDSGSTWSSAIALSSNGRVSTSNGWGYYILWPTNSLPAGVTNIKIQLSSGSGNAWDPQIPFVTVTYSSLDTPAAVNAEAGAGQNYLTWANVPGASSYNVYRSTSSGGEGATPVATGITTASYSPHYTDTGLTNGTKYYYTVTAVNPNTESSQSSEVSATPAVGYTILEDDLANYNNVNTASANFTGLDSSSSPFFNYDQSRAERTSDTTEYLIYKYSVIRDFAVRLHTFGTGTINDFSVYYSTDGGTTYNSVAITTGSGTTPWTLWGNGWEYYNIKPTSALPDGVTNIKFQISSTGNSWDPQVGHIDVSYSAPTVPAGLSCSPTNAQATISWTASPGATSYNLYRSTSAGGEGATAYKTGLTGTSYTDTGLSNGTTYYYKLTAVDSTAESAQSSEVSGTPNAPPSAPTNLYGSAGSGTVSLNWTASTGGGTITYTVLRSTSTGGPYSAVTGGSNLSGTSFTDPTGGTAPTNGVHYYYVVTATNNGGTSGNSNQVEFTPGTAAVDSINSGGSAVGNFVADTDYSGGNSALVSSDTIDTSYVDNPAPPSIYQTSRLGTSTYTIPGLTAGNVYTVRLHFCETYWSSSGQRQFNVLVNGVQVLTNFDIIATAGAKDRANVQEITAAANSSGQIVIEFVTVINNAEINGIEIVPSTVTPGAAPTGLNALGGNGQVDLTWSSSSGATSYNIYRSTSPGGEGSTPYVQNITTTTYTDFGVSSGTTYYYTVAGVTSALPSTQSSEANAVPGLATATTDIDAGGSAVGAFSADTDFTGGGAGAVSTDSIDTSAVTNPAPAAVYQTSRLGNFTYTITGLTASSSYDVRLHFCDTYWSSAGQREFDVSINGTQVLTNFDVIATTGAKDKADVQQFSTTADGSGDITIVFTSVVDQAMVNGIEVEPPPTAPAGLTATAGATSIALSWTAASGASGYNVYRGTSSGGEGGAPIAQLGIGVTSYTDSSVTNGITYYYTVKSVNSAGTSTASNEAYANLLPTPTGLAATPGDTQVSLSWNAVSGAASYDLYRATSSGGEGSSPYKTGLSTSYTDTGLTDGTHYYYTVTAVNSNGQSIPSSEVMAIPSAASGTLCYQINAGGGASSPFAADEDYTGGTAASWGYTEDVTAFDAAPAAIYQTERYGVFSYTLGSLVPSANYVVRLHEADDAYTSVGQREFNVAINGATVLTNFDIVAAAGAGKKAVVRNFNATADSSGNITISTSNGAADNPTINGIEIISGSVLAAPTNLAATSTTTTAVLSWTAPSGTISSYNLYRSTSPGAEGSTPYVTGISGSATTYTDTGLTTGTKYYYELVAVNGQGESALSTETVAIPNTTGTTCYQINAGGSATGSWLADLDYSGGTNASWGYTEDVTAVNSAPAAIYQTERWGVFTYTLGGLTPSANYVVRLHEADNAYTSVGKREFNVAINGTTVLTNFDIVLAAGAGKKAVVRNFNATADSNGKITISTSNGPVDNPTINGIEIIAGTVLAAPTSPSATATNAQVVVGWTAPTGTISSYNLYRSTSAGTEGSTPYKTGIGSGATSYTDTGVSNGTTYYYKIVAVNAYGESALSTEASSEPNAPPSAPTGVTAVPGNASVSLSWTASTGGGTITYTVERSTVSGGPYSAVTGGSGLSGTSFTDPTGGTAPSNGTTYYYIVVASNNGGTASSTEVSVTPDPPKLLLVKRITAINGVAVTGFVADGTGNDTNVYWPSPSSTYLRGGTTSTAKPGDTVEYTIYYLVTGSGSLTNISISDVLPVDTTFASTAYNGLTPTDGGAGNSGIALASSASAYPTGPTVYMSDASDTDRGTFYAPGVAVSGICTAAQNVSGVVVVNVVATPTALPASTSAASPYNAYGFVRYELTIN